MNKEAVVYLHIHTQKKWNQEILAFVVTWMDLGGIMLSETNQTEEDKYSLISLRREI